MEPRRSKRPHVKWSDTKIAFSISDMYLYDVNIVPYFSYVRVMSLKIRKSKLIRRACECGQTILTTLLSKEF